MATLNLSSPTLGICHCSFHRSQGKGGGKATVSRLWGELWKAVEGKLPW